MKLKEKGEVIRNLTSSHLTDGFDNTDDIGVTFFMMDNLSRQTRHLIIKNRYLL
jgi:hypothetical protein